LYILINTLTYVVYFEKVSYGGGGGMDMVEVEGMDTVEEHYHSIKYRTEVEDMDTMEEHYHPINHRPELEGMDREDSGMGEDMMVEVEVVRREPKGVVLARSLRNQGVQKVNHVCKSELQLLFAMT
jgi:hypothetical protein